MACWIVLTHAKFHPRRVMYTPRNVFAATSKTQFRPGAGPGSHKNYPSKHNIAVHVQQVRFCECRPGNRHMQQSGASCGAGVYE